MTKMRTFFYLFLSMLQPKFLKTGDTVAIVSTARKISLNEIQPAIDLLKSWRLKIVIGTADHQYAGSDDLRFQDFQQLLDDSSIHTIWCARGGYGTIRIIDQLNFTSFLKNPKWIVGSSDVTVLHTQLQLIGVISMQQCL